MSGVRRTTSCPTPAESERRRGTGATADAPAELLGRTSEDAFVRRLSTLATHVRPAPPARWRFTALVVWRPIASSAPPDCT